MKPVIRIGLLAALALFLSATGTANAAVTSSNVTSPGDPYVALDDDDALVPATLTVSGTSNGTAGDLIDIVCTHDGSVDELVGDVAVNANGTFQGTGPLENIDENACFLRGLPDATGDNGINRFRGPRAFVSSRDTTAVSGGPNDGLVYEYDAFSSGFKGYWELSSLSGGSIDDGSALGLPALDDEGGAWDDGSDLRALTDEGERPSIVVDGRFAYGSDAAVNLFGGAENNAGLQPLTFSTTQDPATGDLTVTESQILVRCATDSLAPDGVSCPSFESTGVRWDRTHVVRQGALQDRIVDTLASVDAAAHNVDVVYQNDFEDGETGWMVPPSDRFDRYSENVLSGADIPEAPFSVIAREADDEPDGSIEAGLGGITFAQKPTEMRWVRDDTMEAQYVQSVPAGGSVQIRQTYSQSLYLAEALELVARAEDAFAGPETTITSGPREKVKLRGKAKKTTATFEFVSSRANSTFECKLDNGAFEPCTSPQTYGKVKKGKHTFEVRAINQEGLVDATPASDKWKVVKKKKKKGKGGGKGKG